MLRSAAQLSEAFPSIAEEIYHRNRSSLRGDMAFERPNLFAQPLGLYLRKGGVRNGIIRGLFRLGGASKARSYFLWRTVTCRVVAAA